MKPILGYMFTGSNNGTTTELTIEFTDGSMKRMQLACTTEQLNDGFDKFERGAMIQDAFPFLNPDEREFILTGTTPEEWDAMFKE